MSKSIEVLNRIETIMPFNRENKPNYYRQFMQSETPFYEDIDLVKKDLKMLEIIKKYLYCSNKSHCIRMREIRKRQSNFDYEDLKEWLDE